MKIDAAPFNEARPAKVASSCLMPPLTSPRAVLQSEFRCFAVLQIDQSEDADGVLNDGCGGVNSVCSQGSMCRARKREKQRCQTSMIGESAVSVHPASLPRRIGQLRDGVSAEPHPIPILAPSSVPTFVCGSTSSRHSTIPSSFFRSH